VRERLIIKSSIVVFVVVVVVEGRKEARRMAALSVVVDVDLYSKQTRGARPSQGQAVYQARSSRGAFVVVVVY